MRIHAVFATLAATALSAALCAPAQSTAPPASAQKPAHPAHRRTAKAAAASPVAHETAPTPKPPDWPVDNPPSQANVVWDSQGLRIQAANSSLEQILKDISTETGARIEGFDKDQRIFGSYGPGSTRDVLSQLLDGSGYNVLMVGGQSEANPLEVVLSAPPTGPAPPVQNNPAESADSDADDNQDQPQPQPQAVQAPIQPGAGQPPRTPQEILQELQQRQQRSSPF